MKITVDCRVLKSSGIGAYIRGCLPFLLQSGNDLLLIGDSKELSVFIHGAQNVKLLHYTEKPFSLSELFLFPSSLKKEINSSDAYFTPFFNIPGGVRVPIYTTVHDTIFLDLPGITSWIGFKARQFFYKRCFRRSKKIFTVSVFSKERILFHSKNKRPVTVTHIALQPQFIEFKPRLGSVKKTDTVLFVGNIKKHKGLDYLLDAFQAARASGLKHKLRIVGSAENFRSSDNSIQEKIKMMEPGAVEFTGFISDETLVEYMASAALLVQPSLYEGFCLPPLEAMSLGTKALVSDIPVLREIYTGFPVTYFRAGDSADLREKLLQLLSLKPETIRLSEDLLSRYTFKKTTAIILKEITE